jgi:DNA-binding LacI/PurR family transcriptional regulator
MGKSVKNKRPTLGVLAGIQVYYETILGNFIGPLLHGVSSAAENRQCNLLLACGMNSPSYTAAHPGGSLERRSADRG